MLNLYFLPKSNNRDFRPHGHCTLLQKASLAGQKPKLFFFPKTKKNDPNEKPETLNQKNIFKCPKNILYAPRGQIVCVKKHNTNMSGVVPNKNQNIM